MNFQLSTPLLMSERTSLFSHPDEIDFSGFMGRSSALKEIYRYSNFPESFYRSNLLLHSRRIFFLLQSVIPQVQVAFPDADIRRMQVLSLMHDDVEMLIGDFQAGNRVKMTSEQLAAIDQKEEVAIQKMGEMFPEYLEWYGYTELLREIFEKNTIESQIVKYLDHIDAFGEALHEIYAGNRHFVTRQMKEYGETPIPPDYYIPRFNDPGKYYPLIGEIMGDTLPFCSFERIDFEPITENGKLHDIESITIGTGYPIYDWWRGTLWGTEDEMVREGLVELSQRVIL